jgi:hypothetical protein
MNTQNASPRLGLILGTLLLSGALVLAGCDVDKLLEVTDPDTVNPQTLDDPDVLDVVINGALGDFTNAYSGDGLNDAFLIVTAAMSDEVFSSGTFPTRTATDRRNQQPPADGNTSDLAYNDLQIARRALKDAAAKVADFRGKSDAGYGELKALEGYTYVALGEGFCSAIPLSYIENGEWVYGEPQTVDQVWTGALTVFDEALANGGGSLAAVGKGRALLNLGQYAAAAAAVASVPTSYLYDVFHSASGAQNPVYTLQGNGRYSLSDGEGGNGLMFRSAGDPRVPWIRDPAQPNGFDAAYPLYKIRKYNAFTSPVVLASGVEARLIEAEAALQAGQTTVWLQKLNDLRADVASIMAAQVPAYPITGAKLAPLADPGTEAARLSMMFSERAFWLFGTGHRLGDLRRLVKNYGLSATQVYPSGDYHKGGSFGADLVFPVDFDEGNNPNFDGSMCNVKSAG